MQNLSYFHRFLSFSLNIKPVVCYYENFGAKNESKNTKNRQLRKRFQFSPFSEDPSFILRLHRDFKVAST